MTVKRFELRPGYSISRVIRGGWQLAGGHGAVDRDVAIADSSAAFEAGIVTFDCADIYTGVEELLGADGRLILLSDIMVAHRPGHNVVLPDGRHHTFSQFSSATFNTWSIYSSYSTFRCHPRPSFWNGKH